jgi:hypothetical protein
MNSFDARNQKKYGKKRNTGILSQHKGTDLGVIADEN